MNYVRETFLEALLTVFRRSISMSIAVIGSNVAGIFQFDRGQIMRTTSWYNILHTALFVAEHMPSVAGTGTIPQADPSTLKVAAPEDLP